MINIHPIYETCHRLFTGYPLAARNVNGSGTARSMVLMLPDGDDTGFFVLSRGRDEGKPAYSLWAWPDGDIMDIEAHSGSTAPDLAVRAVTRGVPIPRDGSLFGWTWGAAITALIVIYAEYTPTYPEPGWAVMPLAGAPETQWPPFTGERLFGHWSWEEYRAGSIVSLDGLIAKTPDTVYWVDTKAALGSDCCVVSTDIGTPEGHVLQRGCYVYYQALREGRPVPPMKALLADPGKIDLAPQFQGSPYSGGWPEKST